jgi:hypothetical protein
MRVKQNLRRWTINVSIIVDLVDRDIVSEVVKEVLA